MDFFRMLYGWLCGLTSLLCAWGTFQLIPRALQSGSYKAPPLLRAEALFGSPIATVVFMLAWWTIWKTKASMKFWAIAASLTWILVWLIGYLQLSRFLWGSLAGGIAGLVLFLWRDETKEPVASE